MYYYCFIERMYAMMNDLTNQGEYPKRHEYDDYRIPMIIIIFSLSYVRNLIYNVLIFSYGN